MLGTLLASVVSGETVKAAQRLKSAVIAYAIAAFMGLVGICFLFAALFMKIASIYGAMATTLGFGAGFICLAILVFAIHKLSSTMRKRRAVDRRSAEMKAIAGAAALALLPTLLKRGAGVGALVLPLAAFAAFAIIRENRGGKPDRDSDD